MGLLVIFVFHSSSGITIFNMDTASGIDLKAETTVLPKYNNMVSC